MSAHRRTPHAHPLSLLLAIALFTLGFGAVQAQPTPVATDSTQPTSVAAGATQPLQITSAQNGQTLNATVGQEVDVQLGTNLSWSVSLDTPDILVPEAEGSVDSSGQGAYIAALPGTVNLSITGRPICAPSSPCPQFVIVSHETVIVAAAPTWP